MLIGKTFFFFLFILLPLFPVDIVNIYIYICPLSYVSVLLLVPRLFLELMMLRSDVPYSHGALCVFAPFEISLVRVAMHFRSGHKLTAFSPPPPPPTFFFTLQRVYVFCIVCMLF